MTVQPQSDVLQKELLVFMAEHDVAYERHDHPPVFTVEDVYRLTPDLPGSKTKNLFLCDQKGRRHFLVVVPDNLRVDLKVLPHALDAKGVRFGSAQRLETHLGVTPGSVSLLALFNDRHKAVEVIIDETLWAAQALQFHPLINTSTLVISKPDIERFLQATGHHATILPVPAKT